MSRKRNPYASKWDSWVYTDSASEDEKAVYRLAVIYQTVFVPTIWVDKTLPKERDLPLYLAAIDNWRNANRDWSPIIDRMSTLALDYKEKGLELPIFVFHLLSTVFTRIWYDVDPETEGILKQ